MTRGEPRTGEMLGALLGNYRVLSKLGEGGMGVVYVGRHEALGHSVVVKVLQPELSRNAEMVQRFFNEAQAATAIRNLGIVQVFDFGTTTDGRAYFVMELLEGENLAARLKQRRLGYLECCRIGRQIANVLQAAHARRITHRDLKPENLFLVPDAEAMGGERVKVLDFGIAKLAGDAHTSGVRTRTGLIMGTPHYMSPEQCRGAGAVDARSDIYSLGCILFEMACGRPPFVGEGAGEILGAHQYLDSPPPQSLAPDIPPPLAALIASMLAKRPDARPQTMTAVSQALDEILQTLGAPARSSTSSPVPAPTPPRQALQAREASTTLRDSAGVSNVRASGRASRSPLVLGGLFAAVTIAAIVTVVVMRGGGDAAPDVERTAGTATGSASGVLEIPDTRQVVVTPASPPDAAVPVNPPAPADAAGSASAGGRDLEGECLRYQATQRWGDLDACADRLKAVNPALADEYKRRAGLETKAGPRISAFEAALRDRNLEQAKTELDAIPAAAGAYKALRQKYDQAENAAIADTVARLQRVKGGDCKEYDQIVQQEQASKPPRVASEAQRRVKCTPTPVTGPQQCDHGALASKGNSLYAFGKLVAAVASYEAAWSCKPDSLYAEKAFFVSCNMPSIAKAKLFWRRLPAAMKQRTLGICVRNGITEAQLNAP